jgi:hypothetical protein
VAHGRFVILTDEHVPYALVESLGKAGWLVHRVEDEQGLGKGTDDDAIFAYAALTLPAAAHQRLGVEYELVF